MIGRFQKRFAAAICGSLLALGCAVNPIEMDLVNYINQDILGRATVETAALKRYAAVSGPNYTSDAVLYATLRDEVVPTYGKFVGVLQQIDPKTDTVKQLHAIYISASIYRLRGFETILGGIRLQDPNLIDAANRMLAQSQTESARWQETLKALYETHGIVPQDQ